ncbi:HAD family hydrolase [Streptomyces sp. NPDC047525]|uniref:HAD family hydrolase n=1 Tax=Streptomyces sp. NPDC047525 TaxID=3155264 RepID=UPI0033C9C7BE
MDEKSTVRAVAIDYKAVLRSPGQVHDGIVELLQWLAERDISFVLLTSDSIDAETALRAAGLPAPALHLCRDDIPGRPPRGSGAWLLTVADRLKLRTNQIVMVGTSEWDWRTGINAGVVYVHARWANHVRDNKGMLTLSADEPADVGELLEHFLLDEPRWAFSHDDDARSFTIRSLLPPNVRFPQDVGQTFELQDVFTRGRKITVGTQDARDILMLRLLSSAYLDGTLPHRSLFCVYPSSSPGQVSQQLAGFLTKAKVMVGSYYREDLLERTGQAPDTSLERWRRSCGQASTADISIGAQARTVRINPKYRGKLKGKTVIVFDDFTTEGKSIEWARILLTSANVAQVIALTVGKYGDSRHTAYKLRPGMTIDPYQVSYHLAATNFVTTPVTGAAGPGPDGALKATMSHFIAAAQKAK